ncbi:MAG: AAA family ATPase [Lachnospiraceae bacterium]|nr:AAA family ATPase [Lachnospiraceae bacterium]
MIVSVKNIKNVGKYEHFSGIEQFDKNTIIFGFNGAGKSTLSDIFYSLSVKEKGEMLSKRRTLNRPDENGEKIMEIVMSDDLGNDITYSDQGWNRVPDNIHVFNRYYVEDHVFVSKHLQGSVIPIGMGKDGVKYMKRRDELIDANTSLLVRLNEDIVLLGKAGFKIKDFSNQRVSEKTKQKRLETMASFALFSPADKSLIEEKIKENTKYTKELADIERCEKLCREISGVKQIDKSMLLKKSKRTLRISSKEIAKFLGESLTVADVKWAAAGIRNQKNLDKCPMCGQTIRDKRAIELFDKLGKFVNQNKDESVNQYCSELYLLIGQLQLLELSKRVSIFNEIIGTLKNDALLLKKDTERLKKGLLWTEQHDIALGEIIKKVHNKAEKPYSELFFSKEELDCLELINHVIRNINILEQIINQTKERLKRKIDKKMNMNDIKILFDLSFGPNRFLAERIKNNSAELIRNLKKLNQLNEQIDDSYNQIQLNKINENLSRLNTKINIEVQRNKYYIRLKDYEAKEYEKGRRELFSEGEERAVAFAYFLSEVNDEMNRGREDIIFIDDPICSMDLNRKSIISYQISEMMKNPKWQIIVMTHDISFVEKIESFLVRGVTCKKLDLQSEKDYFLTLNIKDYLTDDQHVYEELILDAECNDDELTKLIALMVMRPYAYVMKVADAEYGVIQKKSTYFSHTLYSKNKEIEYKKEEYENKRLKEYVNMVSNATGKAFDSNRIVSDYSFDGFNFDEISRLYLNIPLDSMKNARKKVLLMRPLIEACFFQLSTRQKFDPENIGSMYAKTIRANKNDDEKYQMCRKLQEVYDSSKKYHHGADGGSLLGISWINPNEIEHYDRILNDVILKIKTFCTIKTQIS